MTGETTPTGPQEIELKLELTAQALKEFRASAPFERMGLDCAPKHKLHATYFDTPERHLKAHNIALRVRDDGQGRLIQTLKASGTPGDIASVREEHETILSPQDPLPTLEALPKQWHDLIKRLIGPSPLKPLFETHVTRQIALQTTPGGDVIEVALDQGWVVAGTAKHQIREIEFELISGTPAALFELALELVHTVPVRIGMVSKSQRGYALPTPHLHTAQKAPRVALSPCLSVEEALADIIRQSLRQIMANEPAVVEARQPDGIHQMRVALRRLRASLQGFGNWVGDPALLAFSVEAKALAESLGGARDMDVFERDIMGPVIKEFPDHTGMGKILLKSKRKRSEAWKHCLATVTSNDFASFLLRLTLYVEKKAWTTNASTQSRLSQPVTKAARSILKRRRAKLQTLAQNLETLSLEERHDMRKHVKKLRYMSVFFSAAFFVDGVTSEKESQQKYLKHLAKLQNRFGALNDVAMAQDVLQQFAMTIGRKSSDLSEAYGLVLGWHMRRAHVEWARMPKLWNDFQELPNFWEEPTPSKKQNS